MEGQEEDKANNKNVVKTLYEALSSGDVNTVHRVLAQDLEWWFHGPPSHQHMMRLLTGTTNKYNSFVFEPLSIVAFGSTVLVEGKDSNKMSWVHAWTVTDGIITKVREYCNTSVTVTRFGNSDVNASPSPSHKCQCVWESKLSDNVTMPGLVLAL